MQRELGGMVAKKTEIEVCHTPGWVWLLPTVCMETSGDQNTEGFREQSHQVNRVITESRVARQKGTGSKTHRTNAHTHTHTLPH